MNQNSRISVPFAALVSLISICLSIGATYAAMGGRIDKLEEAQERLEAQDEKILQIIERQAQTLAQLAAQSEANRVRFENINDQLVDIKRAVGAPVYRGHK